MFVFHPSNQIFTRVLADSLCYWFYFEKKRPKSGNDFDAFHTAEVNNRHLVREGTFS